MDELSASRRGVGSAVLVVSTLVVLLAVGLTAAAMPQAVHLQTAASASAGTVRPGRPTATTAAPTTSVTATTVAPTTSTAAPTPASLASERAALHAAVATSTTVVHRPVATTPTTRPVVTTVPVTAPPTTVAVPPSAAAVLACIRQRESGGNYSAVSANGVYRGAYQFSQATWDGAARLAGRPDLVGVPPNLVSPANQDAVALAEYEAAGLAPWGGHCP